MGACQVSGVGFRVQGIVLFSSSPGHIVPVAYYRAITVLVILRVCTLVYPCTVQYPYRYGNLTVLSTCTVYYL